MFHVLSRYSSDVRCSAQMELPDYPNAISTDISLLDSTEEDILVTIRNLGRVLTTHQLPYLMVMRDGVLGEPS